MAFEENNFMVAKKIKLNKSEFSCECTIQSGSPVAKILSVQTDASKANYEALNGVLNYSGTIDVKIIILTEGNEINTICATCPFSSKFENECIEMGCHAEINVKVLDHSVVGINSDNIRLNVLIEQSGFVVNNKEIKSLKNGDDDICCQVDEAKVVRFLGSASENIEITSELNIKEKVQKILLTESSAVIKNCDSGNNFVSVSGDCITRVLYMTENEKFESGYICESFKEEISLNDVQRDSFCEADACINQEGVISEIISDDNGMKIIIKSPLSITVRAYQEENVSVIKDLYSTKNQLNITTSSFEMTLPCKMEVIEGKIDGNLTLDDDKPRIDKLLFNGGNNVVITNSFVKGNEIFLEGIARTNVVYLNDEQNSLYSVQLEVPFSISDKTDFSENSSLVVHAVVYDEDVAVKKGRELMYDAKVKAHVSSCKDEVGAVITEAEIGEEYAEKDFTMEIVFGKEGEDIWSLAKKFRVKEEQILQQNNEIVFPLSQDSPLILYYQRNN